ncbi:MAG: hypothetical protein ACJAUP_002125 [Cellvibrionaceae bacterium]|jgi:hypothetical protein
MRTNEQTDAFIERVICMSVDAVGEVSVNKQALQNTLFGIR